MHLSRFFLAFILFLFVGCQTTNQSLKPAHTQGHIAKKIDSILQREIPKINTTIQIVSLKTGETVYEKNPNRLLTPASILKLFTGASALYHLGSHFRFTTRIYTKDLIPNGLNHLYLVGGGDPSFNDGDLRNLAIQLRQQGITKIEGNLYVDDSAFDNQAWPSGWMWDDMHEGYSAPISALNANWNRVLIAARPDGVGKPLKIFMEPDTSFVTLNSSAQTGKRKSDRTLEIESVKNRGLKPHETIRVYGKLPEKYRTVYEKFSVEEPSIFAGYILSDELRKQGISFQGKILKKKASPNAIEVAKHDSVSLGEILIDLMKLSNNNGMETLLKDIGLHQSDTPGSFEDGLDATYDFLANEVGIPRDTLRIADGSGGSRYSLVSAAQLTKLLTYAYNNFHIGPELISTLPISGLDGSLMYRFGNKGQVGRVRAKTGGMTGVSSLAGFVEGKNHEVYAFTIIFNGFVEKKVKYQKIQEEILAALI